MIGRWILSRLAPPILVFLLAAVALQIAAWRVGKKYILPAPTEVLKAAIDNRDDLARALLTTSEAALIGFAASTIIGIAAGIALAASPLVRRAFYPYTVFFQTVPIIAIAPLLVIWFDAGLTSVSISAFIVSVFPVIANTLSGLLSTDPALLDLFRLYDAGPVARLWKLRLPWAMPEIMTGLRVAAGLAVIGTVVAEFLVGTLGTTEGLGVKIVGAIKYGQADQAFAAVLTASLLGLAVFGAVNLAGRLVLRHWHASEKET